MNFAPHPQPRQPSVPRQNLGLWTAAVVLHALVALLAPLLLLGGGSPAHTLRAMRDGGAGMWLVLLLNLALPIVLGILGVMSARGRSVPGALLLGLAGLPLLVGLAFGALAHRTAAGAVLGESIDPSQRARILAEGLAGELRTHEYGGLVTAALLAVVAWGCVGAVGSLDRARLGKPAGALWVGALVESVLMAVVPFGIAIAMRLGGAWFLLVLVATLPFAVLAVVAARAVSALEGWPDAAEASRVAQMIVVGGCAASLALYLLADHGAVRLFSLTFSAIAGESVAPLQKARIFEEGLGDMRSAGYVALIQLLLAGGAFLPTILGARAARPLGAGSLAALGLAVLIVAGPLGGSLGSRALAASMIAVYRAPEEPRPTLHKDPYGSTSRPR